ncbi:MAG TPA: SIS domain-containing protein [Usitatibacter sp.]|nr:SIS domain-containing protein [Usitatibacter sp.]
MDLAAHLRTHFEEGAELRLALAKTLPAQIARAGEALAAALRSGRKALACGNGGSAADSQHFAAELVGRFERERPGLPAVALTVDSSALTAIANDYGADRMFARQIEAIGTAGDVLLAISTSGSSPNIVAAAEAARAARITVIALTGASGGAVAPLADVAIRVPSTTTAHIQECHLAIEQLLALIAERALYPDPA